MSHAVRCGPYRHSFWLLQEKGSILYTRLDVQIPGSEMKVVLRTISSCFWWIQEKGYDPVYGARPVKRAVQRELETTLAKGMLRGEFGEEDTVVVEAPGGATANHLELTRKGADREAKPIVDDSLDIDVSRDSYGENGTHGSGADNEAIAGARN